MRRRHQRMSIQKMAMTAMVQGTATPNEMITIVMLTAPATMSPRKSRRGPRRGMA